MHLPPLSDRLSSCAGFVKPGSRVADIGCDHGYLGIYLLMRGLASSVIAADINPQPLSCAQRNARRYGVCEKMSFFLSDGVRDIPRDFDTMICAGMGADTMISILEGAPWLSDPRYRFILQCQSRRYALREYLYTHGFTICEETLAQDGKFLYPVILAQYRPCEALTPGRYYISPALIRSGSPLLPTFYRRTVARLESAVKGLSFVGGQRYAYYQSVLQEVLEMEDQIHGNGC